MSIAANFRTKMDEPLNSADNSRGSAPDCRRAAMQRDLDNAGLALVENSLLVLLMARAQAKVTLVDHEGVVQGDADAGEEAKVGFRAMTPANAAHAAVLEDLARRIDDE